MLQRYWKTEMAPLHRSLLRVQLSLLAAKESLPDMALYG